jgi:hypothetical protein
MRSRRVKIAYSVELDDILGEVAQLADNKGKAKLNQANELLCLVSEVLSRGSALEGIEYMKATRDALAAVDYLLEDSMGILLGYINAKSSETEKLLVGEPVAEDPSVEDGP